MTAAPPARGGMFRSLANRNYRLWASGAILSNVGTWMQRVGQDWLVLAELTHRSAATVGIVMGCQFGPQLVLLPFTGAAADRFDKRRLVMATQAAMGLLALGLGLLVLSGLVRIWHVYAFALLLGCASAFDAPARQSFVSEMVGEDLLANAVALNSTSFNAARMIGPAIAGLLIARVGTGWVFLINAASFVPVLASLVALRVSELHRDARRPAAAGAMTEGFRYIGARPDLKAALLVLLLVGTLGANFPIFISTMAVSVFHAGAGGYGVLSSAMAVGAVTGALLAARRERPTMALIAVAGTAFGTGLALAAAMPRYALFGLVLVPVGVAAQTLTVTTLSLVQLGTTRGMRGRVMAMAMAVALGGTPVGAPFVGWIADRFGPRWALGVGAAAGFAAALVAVMAMRSARARTLPDEEARLETVDEEADLAGL